MFNVGSEAAAIPSKSFPTNHPLPTFDQKTPPRFVGDPLQQFNKFFASDSSFVPLTQGDSILGMKVREAKSTCCAVRRIMANYLVNICQHLATVWQNCVKMTQMLPTFCHTVCHTVCHAYATFFIHKRMLYSASGRCANRRVRRRKT